MVRGLLHFYVPSRMLYSSSLPSSPLPLSPFPLLLVCVRVHVHNRARMQTLMHPNHVFCSWVIPSVPPCSLRIRHTCGWAQTVQSFPRWDPLSNSLTVTFCTLIPGGKYVYECIYSTDISYDPSIYEIMDSSYLQFVQSLQIQLHLLEHNNLGWVIWENRVIFSLFWRFGSPASGAGLPRRVEENSFIPEAPMRTSSWLNPFLKTSTQHCHSDHCVGVGEEYWTISSIAHISVTYI